MNPLAITGVSARAPRVFRLVSLAVALLLALQSVAAAAPPLREWFHFDFDVRLNGASNVCGFEVRGHFVGDAHFTLFYKDGQIASEVDTFPTYQATIYAVSTGKSYTSVGPAILHTDYTDGAAVGSAATAFVTGLVEKIPGSGVDSGRFAFNAVVDHIDAAGVPVIHFVSEISSAGPELIYRIARCNAVR